MYFAHQTSDYDFTVNYSQFQIIVNPYCMGHIRYINMIYESYMVYDIPQYKHQKVPYFAPYLALTVNIK